MGIPENIDALLVKYDINQDHLARIADVTPGAVTGWAKMPCATYAITSI